MFLFNLRHFHLQSRGFERTFLFLDWKAMWSFFLTFIIKIKSTFFYSISCMHLSELFESVQFSRNQFILFLVLLGVVDLVHHVVFIRTRISWKRLWSTSRWMKISSVDVFHHSISSRWFLCVFWRNSTISSSLFTIMML